MFVNVDRADKIDYGNPPVLRLASLYWFITFHYPLAP